jgi:hypothetical protein
MGAVAGSATAGSGNAGTSAGGAGSGDLYASNVAVAVHEEVATVLVVTWNQTLAADETLLEFTFEDGVVMRSRAKPGATGTHRDVVLGVPALSPVTIRVVSPMRASAERYRSAASKTRASPLGWRHPRNHSR